MRGAHGQSSRASAELEIRANGQRVTIRITPYANDWRWEPTSWGYDPEIGTIGPIPIGPRGQIMSGEASTLEDAIGAAVRWAEAAFTQEGD